MQLTPKQARKVAKALERRGVVGPDAVDIIEVFHETGKVLYRDKWPTRARFRHLLRRIYRRVGGGNLAVQPAGLAGAEVAIWKRIHAVNQALVGSGLLHPDFDTDDLELFPEPADTDEMTDRERKLVELLVGAYEAGAGGILTPDLEVLQPGDSLGDAHTHEASRRRRLAAAKQRAEEGLPPGFIVVGPRISPHFDGEGWIPMFSEPVRAATHCVFRSLEEAVEHAWELRDGKFDSFLRPALTTDDAETDAGLEIDREAAVGKLRSMAETDPSNHSERKIHVCGYPGGLIVFCQDAGCEAIVDLTSTGERTLSADSGALGHPFRTGSGHPFRRTCPRSERSDGVAGSVD